MWNFNFIIIWIISKVNTIKEVFHVFHLNPRKRIRRTSESIHHRQSIHDLQNRRSESACRNDFYLFLRRHERQLPEQRLHRKTKRSHFLCHAWHWDRETAASAVSCGQAVPIHQDLVQDGEHRCLCRGVCRNLRGVKFRAADQRADLHSLSGHLLVQQGYFLCLLQRHHWSISLSLSGERCSVSFGRILQQQSVLYH